MEIHDAVRADGGRGAPEEGTAGAVGEPAPADRAEHEHLRRLLGPVMASHVLSGDCDRVAGALVDTSVGGPEGYPEFLRRSEGYARLPERRRRLILDALARRWPEAADTPWSAPAEDRRAGLLRSVVLVGRGLPDLPLAAERAAYVAEAGEYDVLNPVVPFEALPAQELAEGRRLGAATIAALRRTVAFAEATDYLDGFVSDFVATLTDPVLDVGEAWAERAMAEDRFDARPLLAHALTVTGTKPTARWERDARAVLDASGDPAAVRDAVLDWLALVDRPRTLPLKPDSGPENANELYDAHNVTALRGLLWTLPLLPSRPDAPGVLGALVGSALRKVPGTGARSPRVAGAAVRVLARTDGGAAHAELVRLAARLVHRPTLKAVTKALAERGPAAPS
ncbi:hypothetical protein JNUCC64_14935 [Streptomyces sp. JNUCC 64]